MALPIVDSDISREVALRSNPAKPPCPRSILNQLCLMSVHYWGLDGQLHRGQIVVADDAATDVRDMFNLMCRLKFPVAKVVPVAAPGYEWDADKLVLQDNVTYGWDYRFIADTTKLSLHAYGLAVDINPQQNPYIRYPDGEAIVWPTGAVWHPEAPGALHADHDIVRFMERRGWEWGGRWARPDYMHFQKQS